MSTGWVEEEKGVLQGSKGLREAAHRKKCSRQSASPSSRVAVVICSSHPHPTMSADPSLPSLVLLPRTTTTTRTTRCPTTHQAVSPAFDVEDDETHLLRLL